ncbi:MAG: hypothetical protein WDN28_12435 [Chthoniobacter sp.]
MLARSGRNQTSVVLNSVLPLVLFSAFGTLAWFWARRFDPFYGFFGSETRRIVFYVGWGMATAGLAMLFGTEIRRRQGLPVYQDGRVMRVFSLVVVFGLTGLAVWWVGNKAAGCLEKAAQLQQQAWQVTKKERVAARTPHPWPLPDPPGRSFLRKKNANTISTWVEVEANRFRPARWSENFASLPPPRASANSGQRCARNGSMPPSSASASVFPCCFH